MDLFGVDWIFGGWTEFIWGILEEMINSREG
jgi:hypothetical protein